MKQFLWICLAGALGTGCRRVVGVYAPRLLGTTFPYPTLIVNVLGCFLIAGVAHAATRRVVSDELRIILMTGFMGGFTTYSSFNFETTDLLSQRAWALGLLNVGVMVGACFAAGVLGLMLAKWLFGS